MAYMLVVGMAVSLLPSTVLAEDVQTEENQTVEESSEDTSTSESETSAEETQEEDAVSDADTESEASAVSEDTVEFNYDYDIDGDGVNDCWDVTADGSSTSVFAYLAETGEDTYTLTVTGNGRMHSWEDNQVGKTEGSTDLRPYADFIDKITKIEIEEGVTRIGKFAFYNTTSCTEVVFPESSLQEILNSAFRNSGLTSVTIPDSVTSLHNNAFAGCTQLASLTIGSGIDSLLGYLLDMGQSDSRGDNNALTYVYLPSNITSIGGMTFRNCVALTTIKIAASDFTFSNNAGEGIANNYFSIDASTCTSFTWDYNRTLYAAEPIIYVNCEITNAYDTQKYIEAQLNGGTFSEDTRFEYGVLAEPVREGYIFNGWYDNAEFSGEAVTEAVAGNTYYAKWTEDPNVKPTEFNYDTDSDGDGVNDCWDVTADGYQTKQVFAYLSENAENSYTLVVFGEGKMRSWTNETVGRTDGSSDTRPWASYINWITKIDVQEGVTRIGRFAFYNLTSATEVTFPETSLVDILNSAFRNSGLTSVTIPDSVESLENNAFAGCTEIASFNIGSGASKLDMYVLDMGQADSRGENTSLTYIYIPSNITTIGGMAFRKCSALTTIKLGASSFVFSNNGVEGIANNEFSVDASACTSFTWDYDRNNYGAAPIIYVNCEIEDSYDTQKYIEAQLNGGTFADGTELVYGTLAEPVKEGYEFAGWYDNAEFSGDAVTTPSAGKTYYAKWEKKAM